MATIRAYTTIEQSRKLAEILPLESADMYYFLDPTPAGNIYHLVVQQIAFGVRTREPEYDKGDIPCWSLAALRNLLPSAIKPNKDTYLFESHNTFDNSWVYRYYNENDTSYLYLKNINEVDACYEMILKLHEFNLLRL